MDARAAASPQPPAAAGGIFAPGDLVAGRYRIRRFVAAGGVADVYEADELQVGARVALKALRPAGPHDERARERFKREIQLARRVTHRNVCRIFEAGVHPRPGKLPVPYLTMEFLDGETLHERVERGGAMPLAEVARLARQMAAALAAAHEVGVIHRDFKSANVILVPDRGEEGGERAVVTDFGLARAIASDEGSGYKTSVDGFSGTPVYMAPEQATGGEVTPRTDVYALGVVLFEMLTADVPFRGSSPMATVVKRLQEDPPSPRALVADLDRRAEAVVLRCLEREPTDRFASPLEVAAALDQGPTPDVPRRRRRRSRRRLLAAGVALVAALLAAAVWWPRAPPAGRVAVGTPVQLTSAPSIARDPTFSPDGRLIAFAAERGGRSQIFVKEVAPGAAEVQITSDEGDGLQPAFSPDGGEIVFYSRRRGGIWRVARDGADGPRRLTDFGSHPVYSPDGRWIAFQEYEPVDVAERSLPALPPSTLWLVPATGGSPRRLTAVGEPAGGHGEPSWSPDGRRLAFSASDRRRSTIWSVDVEDGDLRLLSDRNWVNVHPVWSADGRSVFYVGVGEDSEQASAYSVWQLAVDPDDGTPRGAPRLVSALGLATIRQIALAPGGDRMVYSALETRSNLHWLPLGADGDAGPSRALTEGRNRTSRPAFSPDGGRLVFDRWYVGVNLDIWQLDLAAGERPRQVTDDPGWDSQATFFPDGRRIAHLSERGGSRALWSLDLETGASARLADLGAETDWARLSPGGRRVAYHSREGGSTINLWILDLVREERRQLTFDRELMGFPVWSPDGTTLAFDARRGADSHVMVISADGGTPRQLTDDPGESWPYSFSPDGRRIAFAGLRDGVWNVYWVALDGGAERRLTANDRRDSYLRYPAWSPRGDGLVYELSETRGDVWLLTLEPAP